MKAFVRCLVCVAFIMFLGNAAWGDAGSEDVSSEVSGGKAFGMFGVGEIAQAAGDYVFV